MFQDYPPSSDFKKTPPFTQLNPDFENSISVPDIAKRDGCLNAASYYPETDAKSDLGIFVCILFMLSLTLP